MSLFLKSQQTRIPGELLIQIDGSVSHTIVLSAVSSVYSSYGNGYSTVNDFNYYSKFGSYMFFGFLRSLAGVDGTIGYSLYQLTINNDSILLDFRDCDYGNGDGIYGTNYNTQDMFIKYFPSNGFKVKNHNSGNYSWVEGDTVMIWDDDRKSVSNYYNSCFGYPSPPQGMTIQNYNGSPKISWSANTEYDLGGYKLWRNLNGGGWENISTMNTQTNSYIDYYVDIINGRNCFYAQYKTQAFDWADSTSDFSITNVIRYGGCFLPRTGNSPIDEHPQYFSVSQNYPNPFNPKTIVDFSIPEPSKIEIRIFDLKGNEVFLGYDIIENAGNYQFRWDARTDVDKSLPAGVYLLLFESRTLDERKYYSKSVKMILLK
ncbi:MAG: hypothetical protein HN647_01540 [Candidatus Marinimicrobia bacterium]|jgi:hypothetical protein|nr:hypothetical protein [Candidatus Neomarinimicrobiota bacterium]MBT7985238.1 hypothetical protein [Candidatus Neomarinimicrobiota bacterium]